MKAIFDDGKRKKKKPLLKGVDETCYGFSVPEDPSEADKEARIEAAHSIAMAREMEAEHLEKYGRTLCAGDGPPTTNDIFERYQSAPQSFNMDEQPEDEKIKVDGVDSVAYWSEQSGYLTNVATTDDSGVSAVIVFESFKELKRSVTHLEEGNDPCFVAFLAEDHNEQKRIFIVGRAERGVRLRERAGEVFVEEKKASKKSKRIPVRTYGDGLVALMEKDGTVLKKVTLAKYVKDRAVRRAQKRQTLLPNQVNAITRQAISTLGKKKQLEKIREMLLEKDASGKSTHLLPQYKKSDNPFRANEETPYAYLAKISTEDAAGLALDISLSSNSRILIGAYESRKNKRKITATTQYQQLLPFENKSIPLVKQTEKEIQEQVDELEKRIADGFVEMLETSLGTPIMQTLCAMISLAIENGSSTTQNVNALMRLRGASDSSKQRKARNEELDLLAELRMTLTIKSIENGKEIIIEDMPIIHRSALVTSDGSSPSRRWFINPDFWNFLQAKRSFAVVPKCLFSLNAQKQEWEWKLAIAICSGWSKGWLGNDRLYKVDGRNTWTTRSLLDTSGLALDAHVLVYGNETSKGKGPAALRRRIREALESLQRVRCDGEYEEAIGEFEIFKHPSDPMLDKIIISPTDAQVAVMRESVLPRAEAKAIATELAASKKATKLLPKPPLSK